MTFSPAYGYYDVTAYGAVGNGTSDDAPHIKMAETACEATGGVVYFPPGTYLIKSSIPVAASNVCWMGAGAGASTILLWSNAGTTTPMVTVSAGLDNIHISDLAFQGNDTNNGLGGAPGADAITFGSSDGAVNHYCKVMRCIFTLTTPGNTLHFWNTRDGEVSQCRFYQVGYNNENSSDSSVTPAVMVEASCINVRVHHCHFEQCYYDGVRLKGLACEISYNYFFQCGHAAINVGLILGNGDGVRMFGNYIDSTSG